MSGVLPLLWLACAGGTTADSGSTTVAGDSGTTPAETAEPTDSVATDSGSTDSGTPTDTSPEDCRPDKVLLDLADAYPEGVDVGPDGAVYVSSLTGPTIYRAGPCEQEAVAWTTLQATTHGSVGLLVDADRGLLWACATAASGQAEPAIEGFELTTGAAVRRHALSARGTCNDLALDQEGRLYATESNSSIVYQVAADAVDGDAAAVWLDDEAVQPGPGQYGLNGVAERDGSLILAGSGAGQLYQVGIGPQGQAGQVLETSQARDLVAPDGLEWRSDDTLFIVEGQAGRIASMMLTTDLVTTVVEGLDFPTTLAVDGDSLWIVESQLDHKTGQDPNPPELPFEILRLRPE